VKSGTIDDCVRDAAKWIAATRKLHPDSADKLDPRYNPVTMSIHEDIKKITTEVKRWESDPRRRNPLTKSMLECLLKKYIHCAPHGFTAAIKNWFILGLYIGPRQAEWAQQDGVKSPETCDKNIDGTNKAFIVTDMKCFGPNRRRMTHLDAVTTRAHVQTVDIKWRFQKNGNNGQEKTITCNRQDPAVCGVNAALDILERAMLLNLPDDHPLAVYADDGAHTGTVRFIQAHQIAFTLQEVAKEWHGITDKRELSLCSSHSLRVGACVALHAAGLDAMSIKFALRWTSDAFLMCLRNITRQAQTVSAAIAGFSADVLDIPLHDV